MVILESMKLPGHFRIEPELREQLSGRPGHQRCVEGRGELLLILHEVPKPGVAQRTPLYFWKSHDGRWAQESGAGLGGLGELLDRYEKALDEHGETVESARTAREILPVLRHGSPLLRSIRELLQAVELALHAEPDDREIRGLRDRVRDLERSADLLHGDARVMQEYWLAERIELQSLSTEKLGRVIQRVGLLIAVFLPLIAVSLLSEMNWVEALIWLAVMGAGLFWVKKWGGE